MPLALELEQPVRVHLKVSDNLPQWAKTERVHEVLLRIGISGTTEIDRICFVFNERELPARIMRRINQIYRMSAPRNRSGPSYWCVFRLDAEHWPQQGENILEVTLLERDSVVPPARALRDVELEIKYLQGRSFHRNYIDPDLGPNEQLVS